jgi:ribonucleoside-diphosphate reductase alpha chain
MLNKQAGDQLGNLATNAQALVKKRDGKIAPFDGERIIKAIEKAFRAELDIPAEKELVQTLAEQVEKIGREVIEEVSQNAYTINGVDVEHIQDIAEQKLMQYGHYSVARRYIVYREDRAKARALQKGIEEAFATGQKILVKKEDGSTDYMNWQVLKDDIEHACRDLGHTNPQNIAREISRTLYNEMSEKEVDKATVLAARAEIEKEPSNSLVASRLLLNMVYKEVFERRPRADELEKTYRDGLKIAIETGIKADLISDSLLKYDFDKLAAAIKPERDDLFLYMGLQTIYDRYLLHVSQRRFEAPQHFWMRVSMGLAINEPNREESAIEFYNVLSTFRYISSTPTLFNSATLHPQLSSCYLSTVKDDLEHIFKVVSDNAKLSKWAGGIGNDWTSVRSTGALIKGTNGESQGVIPFLKVANDTAVAVNQGGKRKGAVCAYLESWHLEIEDFLDLRKNTGDERRRTHDMNTANWVPDLFLKRVESGGDWTLFSPCEVPDLHEIYGKEFEKRYEEYEKMADEGKIRLFRRMPAVDLWRKMLSRLFETGHPWITFKDPSNIRSPQDHAGVVHNSNLCTEILLNTSKEETAVCNLGSVNLAAHTTEDGLNEELLKDTIRVAVRMLDNVIDINFYPTIEAQNSNLKHRPVGLGIMGFQDALYKQRISYASQAAVDFADSSMEMISYYAILSSTELAKERGAYGSYKNSKWDRGLLPIDTLQLLEEERGGWLEVDRSSKMDWSVVREAVKKYGMRNSNVMAIAPTATIANIAGVTQSIEPTYRNLYVKSNLSGEFTVVNPYLVEDLKKLNLWDDEMIDDLKYYDGSLFNIERIPRELSDLYLTAFEVEPKWLIECASRRQKWIDMGESLNLYISVPSGKMLSEMYMMAWKKGLKTTYYLRSMAATQVEKSSIDINRRGIQPKWMKSKSASSNIDIAGDREDSLKASASVSENPDDTECEACQ